ncbi:hypothetical protein NDU88_000785 [Pleurodeles waltl]|uniref:Murine leukemia virus integrase C-terminal domain-containing protein n=1 Tax=Pleurodeles waltl TaxID=8319 RepID=A0AAV7TG05_PLEWA|nr:hypothetical protein NDU88_000785 [Pleurodeles waltl]
MRLPAIRANALVNITDDMVLDYCKSLADVVLSFSHQVEVAAAQQTQGQGHSLRAGDWVLIQKHVRKSCLEPRWKGPYQIMLTTTTAVKCAGLPNWVHASHMRKVNDPTERQEELLKLPTVENTENWEKGCEQNVENDRDVPTPIKDEREQSSEEVEQAAKGVEESVQEERNKTDFDPRRVSSNESKKQETTEERSAQRRVTSVVGGLTNQTEEETDPNGKGIENSPAQVDYTLSKPIAETSEEKGPKASEDSILRRLLTKGTLKGDN